MLGPTSLKDKANLYYIVFEIFYLLKLLKIINMLSTPIARTKKGATSLLIIVISYIIILHKPM